MQKAEAQKSDVRNWSTVFFCTFLALAGPSTMDLFWDFGTQRFIRKTFFRKMEPLKSCPKKVMWEIGLLQCSFVPFWPWLNLQQWISSGILEHNPTSSSWQKATYKKLYQLLHFFFSLFLCKLYAILLLRALLALLYNDTLFVLQKQYTNSLVLGTNCVNQISC